MRRGQAKIDVSPVSTPTWLHAYTASDLRHIACLHVHSNHAGSNSILFIISSGKHFPPHRSLVLFEPQVQTIWMMPQSDDFLLFRCRIEAFMYSIPSDTKFSGAHEHGKFRAIRQERGYCSQSASRRQGRPCTDMCTLLFFGICN